MFGTDLRKYLTQYWLQNGCSCRWEYEPLAITPCFQFLTVEQKNILPAEVLHLSTLNTKNLGNSSAAELLSSKTLKRATPTVQ